MIVCWRLFNPGGASDRAVWWCGEGSETADAGAPSTEVGALVELMLIPANHSVLSQRAVAVEIVLYKADHI